MKDEKKKPGVMLYFADFRRPIRCMTDTELGKLFRSVMEYAENGVLPDWYDDPGELLAYLFDGVRQKIDRDALKYREIVENSRRAANLRWSKNADASERIQTNADASDGMHKMLTVNVNGTETVNENENENENVEEKGEEKRAETEEMTDDRFNTLRNEKINQLLNWRN